MRYKFAFLFTLDGLYILVGKVSISISIYLPSQNKNSTKVTLAASLRKMKINFTTIFEHTPSTYSISLSELPQYCDRVECKGIEH